MATTTTTPVAPKSTRRVFAVGRCHHRVGGTTDGKPDCKKQIVAKGANLCPAHEAVWQKAARVRYAARKATAAAVAAAATTATADEPKPARRPSNAEQRAARVARVAAANANDPDERSTSTREELAAAVASANATAV